MSKNHYTTYGHFILESKDVHHYGTMRIKIIQLESRVCLNRLTEIH